MSLTKDERTTLVTLELKKARDTFEEITILTAANKWSELPIVFTMQYSMQSMHFSFMTVTS